MTVRGAALLGLVAAGCAGAPGGGERLRVERDDARQCVAVFDGDHEIVAWRHGAEFAIPHWFPLRSPSGKDLIAQHPDPYPHHRAMWIADKVQLEDGEVVDFYHCTKNRRDPADAAAGYRHFIRQRELVRCDAEGDTATVVVQLDWLADGVQPVLDDERTMVVRGLGGGEAMVDLAWTLRASHGAVTFHSDPVHYAWPYLRVHPQFAVEHGGVLVDDAGRRGQQATNLQYANWIDCSGTVGGVTEGVAVMAPQDGAWRKWLTRDYGTFGPRRPDALSGTRFTLARGEALSGAVRLYVHRGDAETARVAARYRAWVDATRGKAR